MCPTDEAAKLLLELVALGVAIHIRKKFLVQFCDAKHFRHEDIRWPFFKLK